MQRADALELGLIDEAGDVEAEADVNVLLRQVVLVDQHLTDLVGDIEVFAFLGVMVLKQEVALGVFDDGPGVGLDFVHHSRDFDDLAVERGLRTEEDMAIGWAVLLRSSTSLA